MSSQGTSGNHCAGGAGVENPNLVFPTVGVADRDTPQTSQDKEPDSANTPSQLPRHTIPPSRVRISGQDSRRENFASGFKPPACLMAREVWPNV